MTTIAAISTALNPAGISIIRVSGPKSINIVNKIFSGSNLESVASHTINYGHIFNKEELVDEVLVSIMKKPNSFTKEDVVEVNCHGGIAVTNMILKLILKNGAELSEPGEFTKRAFLNGRIDLLEAEGIMDMINAETEIAQKYAANKLKGTTSLLIKNLRQDLLELIANIEVNIDYPEYEDAQIISQEILLPKIIRFKEKLNSIILESNRAQLLANGITTAILGKPNVGKSSLLNKLLDEEKAIVTNIPGTTRDFVEGRINLDGLLLNLVDTAGIRNTKNIVEEIGVGKSLDIMSKADLVLFVIDSNKKITKEEILLIKKLDKNNSIIIKNKNDLKSKINLELIKEYQSVSISALNNDGIIELKETIIRLFNLEKINNYSYLTKIEDITKLENAQEKIINILKGIELQTPVDLLEIDIKDVWNLLGSIIGESYENELVDQLFSQFCLGK